MLLLIKNHFVINILRQPQKKGYPTISNLSAEKTYFRHYKQLKTVSSWILQTKLFRCPGSAIRLRYSMQSLLKEKFIFLWTLAANGLFSHPSDFTPVCTSEFVTFGAMTEEFKALNCQLIGLSVDGLYSHIAWLRTIREKIEYKGKKNVEVQFPLIADVTMEVAHLYGMIQPRESSTNAVRAVFYIDPQGIIRAIIYYPLALGRNFDELKRVLIGLQTIDKYGVALPADWRPGDEVIAPTPGSFNAANERMDKPASGTRCYDWFFCLKKLPAK